MKDFESSGVTEPTPVLVILVSRFCDKSMKSCWFGHEARHQSKPCRKWDMKWFIYGHVIITEAWLYAILHIGPLIVLSRCGTLLVVTMLVSVT